MGEAVEAAAGPADMPTLLSRLLLFLFGLGAVALPRVTPPVSLAVTGDVMLGREVNVQSIRLKDFTYPFHSVSEFLSGSDMVLVNLESPIVADCPQTSEGMVFCSPPASVDGLVRAGVTVANLANNHALNYGPSGLAHTADTLASHGISPVGLGSPVVKSVKGHRFGFLGYNAVGSPQTGIAWADPDRLQADIADLASRVDYVVVTLHWGQEYTAIPTARQVSLAHAAVDAGADIVVGHHPHWTQTVEEYQDKHIVYSLGNFVFDQLWSTPTRQGYVAQFTFSPQGNIDLQLRPVLINTDFQPVLQ